jgi:hypothetical protein
MAFREPSPTIFRRYVAHDARTSPYAEEDTMGRITGRALGVVALLSLLGCAATTRFEPGVTEVRMLETGEVVMVPLSGFCPTLPSADGGFQEAKCQAAKILSADDPRGIPLWQFEMRIVNRGPYGAPMGRRPVDVLVAGEQECRSLRALITARGTPTEACERAGYSVMPTGSAASSR